MWRPHGGHRETYGCPAPTPFSTLSRRSRRMKLQIQAVCRCASPPAGVVRSSCPQTRLSASNLRSKSRSHHPQTTTRPILPALLFTPRLLPCAFLITPTPLHVHKCLPSGGFLQIAVSDARPAQPWRTYLRSVIGRIRRSTSVSGQRDEALRHGRIDLRKSGVSRRRLLFADYSPGSVVRWLTQRRKVSIAACVTTYALFCAFASSLDVIMTWHWRFLYHLRSKI
jgi:hypothetical protein